MLLPPLYVYYVCGETSGQKSFTHDHNSYQSISIISFSGMPQDSEALLQRLSQVSVLLRASSYQGGWFLGKGGAPSSLFSPTSLNYQRKMMWKREASQQAKMFRTPESPVGEDPFSSCWSSPQAVCASTKGSPGLIL